MASLIKLTVIIKQSLIRLPLDGEDNAARAEKNKNLTQGFIEKTLIGDGI